MSTAVTPDHIVIINNQVLKPNYVIALNNIDQSNFCNQAHQYISQRIKRF